MFLINYLKEVISLSRQVTWPTRDTLIQLTVVVIFLSAGLALTLGGSDYLLTNSLKVASTITNPKVIVPTPAIEFEQLATPSATVAPTQTKKPIKK